MDSFSTDAEIQIPSAEDINRSQFLINVIVFTLHYFGCDAESISGVLNEYRLDGGTSDQVAQYIKDNQHIEYFDKGHWHPEDGRLHHTKGKGECAIIIKTKYAHGLPVKMLTVCPLLPALIVEKTVVVQATDGRKIKMIVTCRKFYCSIVR